MARVMLGRAQTTIGRLERSDLLRRIPDYPSTAFNTFPDGSDMNTSSSDGYIYFLNYVFFIEGS